MITAEITSKRIWDGKLTTHTKEFNDEQHLTNYINAIIRKGNLKYKYIGHRIRHANENAMFNLNQVQLIFDLAKEGEYKDLRELLKQEFKLHI